MIPVWCTLHALALLCSIVRAQSYDSTNLTITFSSDSPGDCANKTDGITFSTASIPISSVCFNLDELFDPLNSSTGSIDQPLIPPNDPYQVSWVLYNQDLYNPATNYSRIWYQQVNSTGQVGTGQGAARQLTIYSDRNCRQGLGAEPRTLQPWIGYTCQSGEGGQCDTAPMNVKSFLVADAAAVNAGYPQCWDFAYLGKAPTGRRGAGVLAVLVGVVLAVFLGF